MAIQDFSTVSQDSQRSGKENRENRRHTMAAPTPDKKRSASGNPNSHATLGINVALADKNTEPKDREENLAPYFSSPVKVSPRVHRAERDDVPSIKVPSCSGLPFGWDSVHDRCIAYLSTHAPLTASGKIPADEFTVERYTYPEMSEFLIARFPVFRGLKKIPTWAIEKRLQTLDLNDNEYFKVRYGGYKFEDWGRDI